MILPLAIEPTATPRMAAVLISELFNIDCSFVHSNLAVNTAAVWVFPHKAQPVWKEPRPSDRA